MKKKYPRILVLAILSLVTALVWAASDIVRSFFFKKPETKVSDEILAPINPTLDKDTLNAVQNALYFDPNQIVSSNVNPSSTPGPSSVASPVATTSATPEVQVTPTGNLIASPSP